MILPPQRDLLGSVTHRGSRYWGAEAQQLFDGGRQQGRIAQQSRELVGVQKQGQRPTADQVRGGLVSGHKEKIHHPVQFLPAELVPRLFRLEQPSDQVVRRRPLPLLEERLEVAPQALRCRDRRRPRELRRGPREERVGPVAKLSAVGRRDAKHLRDDGDRQWKGVVVDHVHFPAGGNRIQERVGDRLDARPQLLDHPRRERLGDQPPEPRVVGWVAVQ
jgi:hypothetical protein